MLTFLAVVLVVVEDETAATLALVAAERVDAVLLAATVILGALVLVCRGANKAGPRSVQGQGLGGCPRGSGRLAGLPPPGGPRPWWRWRWWWGGVPGGASSRASRVAQLWGEKVEVGWTECWGLELTNVGTLYHYLLTGQTDK